jgi:hypothetical protein
VCLFRVRSASRNCHVSPRGRWLRVSAMQASSSAKTSKACLSAPIASATRRNKSSNPELAALHFAGGRSGFAVSNDPQLRPLLLRLDHVRWERATSLDPCDSRPSSKRSRRQRLELRCKPVDVAVAVFLSLVGAGEVPQHALCCPTRWPWRCWFLPSPASAALPLPLAMRDVGAGSARGTPWAGEPELAAGARSVSSRRSRGGASSPHARLRCLPPAQRTRTLICFPRSRAAPGRPGTAPFNAKATAAQRLPPMRAFVRRSVV